MKIVIISNKYSDQKYWGIFFTLNLSNSESSIPHIIVTVILDVLHSTECFIQVSFSERCAKKMSIAYIF